MPFKASNAGATVERALVVVDREEGAARNIEDAGVGAGSAGDRRELLATDR